MSEEKNKQNTQVAVTPILLNEEDEREITSQSSLFPSKKEWQMMQFMAQTFQQAGALPKGIDTVPKLMVALTAGREYGLAPVEALNSFYFVNGKVSMYGEAVTRQLIKAGHKVTWGKYLNEKNEVVEMPCTNTQASVMVTRGDTGESMGASLTMQQATERGYTSNPIFKKYPENMLKYKVLGMIAKFIAPDALSGISIKEDIETAEIVDFTTKPTSDVETGFEEPAVQIGNVKVEVKQRPSLADALNIEEEIQIEKPKTRKKKEEVIPPTLDESIPDAETMAQIIKAENDGQ